MEGKAQVLKSAPLDYVPDVSYNQGKSVIEWRVMDPQVIPWIAVIFIIVFLAAYRYGKRRGEDLRTFARQRGLTFSARADSNADEEFRDFLLFSDNSDKQLSNVIRGEVDGAYVMMFDYRSTTGVGQSASTRSQSVISMRSLSFNPPAFEMYPKDISRRVLGVLSKKGIDFPYRRGFSESYVLIGEDENAVRRVFSDTALSYFENHPGLTVEVKGGRLLYYRNGKIIRPDDARSFLQQGLEILRLFE